MPMPPNVINLSEHLPPEHEHAVAKAIEWLSELHRKGWANAIAATLEPLFAAWAVQRAPGEGFGDSIRMEGRRILRSW